MLNALASCHVLITRAILQDAEVGAILTITTFPNTDTASTLVGAPGVSGACALRQVS